jgi:cation transport regulator ChaB
MSDMSSWTLEQRRAYEAERETVSGMDRAELANEARAQVAAAMVRMEYAQDQAQKWGPLLSDLPDELRQRLEQLGDELAVAQETHHRLSADPL